MTNKPIPAAPALPDVAEGMRFTDAVIAAENAKSFMIYQTNKTWQHRGTLTEFSDDERATNDWLPVAGAGEQRGKWPECQRYESATGEIFNVRLVNKPENKIVYTRSDVDLNGIFTVTLSEWLADLGAGEQRGETPTQRCHICRGTRDECMDNEYCQNRWPRPEAQQEQREDTQADKVRAVWEKVTRHKTQEAQPLPARPKMRSGDMASHYAIDETNAYMNYLEAELSRLTSQNAQFIHTIANLSGKIAKLSYETLTSKEEQGGWIDPRTQQPCRRCYGTGKMPPWPGSKGLVACGVCREIGLPTKCEEIKELARLSSPIFKSFSHMIGEILDRIDMAPNDDPIPYIREYVDGLRKSHLTSAPKEEQEGLR